MQGYELVEHTADIGVRAWAASGEGVFEEAAKAMFSLICDPMTIEQQQTIEVTAHAEKPDLLLVAWLNELIYLFEARRVLFSDFDLQELEIPAAGPARLRARVGGETLDPARHAICGGVKAATLHQLSLTHEEANWQAFVILDV